MKKVKHSNQNIWNQHYTKNHSFLKIPDENVVRYFQKQNNLQNKIILDLGAGTCRNSFFLSQICKTVIAQDYALQGLQKAQNIYQSCKNIFFVYSKTNTLPYQDNSFDFILAWGVLHYLNTNSLQQTIQEMQRVLKPNGRMLTSIRSTKDTHAKKVIQSGDLKSAHITYFNKRKIKKKFSMFQNISFGFTCRSPISENRKISHHIVEIYNN